MHKRVIIILVEGGLVFVAVVVDAMTSLAPTWVWASAAVVCFASAVAIQWPTTVRKLVWWRKTTPPIPVSSDRLSDLAPIERFKELESIIARHRKALRPIRDFGSISLWSITGQWVLRADHEELIAYLDALKIPHPPDDAGRATWFNYLVRLESACQDGDLQEARSLHENREEEC